MEGRSFTLRAIIPGLLIGVLINLSSTYSGLRVGAGSQMAIVSGLLGYVSFKLFSRYTTTPPAPSENVLVIHVATATGCMSLTAGFIEIIPALEYLINPEGFRGSCGAAESQLLLVQSNEINWKAAMSSLLRGAIASGIIVWPCLYLIKFFGSG